MAKKNNFVWIFWVIGIALGIFILFSIINNQKITASNKSLCMNSGGTWNQNCVCQEGYILKNKVCSEIPDHKLCVNSNGTWNLDSCSCPKESIGWNEKIGCDYIIQKELPKECKGNWVYSNKEISFKPFSSTFSFFVRDMHYENGVIYILERNTQRIRGYYLDGTFQGYDFYYGDIAKWAVKFEVYDDYFLMTDNANLYKIDREKLTLIAKYGAPPRGGWGVGGITQLSNNTFLACNDVNKKYNPEGTGGCWEYNNNLVPTGRELLQRDMFYSSVGIASDDKTIFVAGYDYPNSNHKIMQYDINTLEYLPGKDIDVSSLFGRNKYLHGIERVEDKLYVFGTMTATQYGEGIVYAFECIKE